MTTLDEIQNTCLGLERKQCTGLLAEQNLQTVLFARWMLIPKLGILLTFQHQQCVAIDWLNQNNNVSASYN